MSRPATDDPFTTLGLPHTFRLDSGRLRAAQRRLALDTHPDHASSAIDAAERARRSAAINEAYRQLADPLTRAERLLERFGGAADTRVPLPQDFLIEAMELREALDEAIASGDSARIQELRAAAEGRRDAELAALAERFDDVLASTDATRPAALAATRAALAKLRYVLRLVARASDPDAEPTGLEA